MADLTGLDAAIRRCLDGIHEDWCDRRDPLMAEDDRDCNCRMGPLASSLRAILDDHRWGAAHAHDLRQVIANALGVDHG